MSDTNVAGGATLGTTTGATSGQPFTAGTGRIHVWGLGAVADYWLYSMIAQITFPLTVTFGINPVLLGWVTGLPRFISALSEVFIGHWSDITHTRWGRRRPFLLVTTILGVCGIVAVWWVSPAWPQWLQFVYLLLACSLLYVSWSIYNTCHYALGFELSDDYANRSKVMAIRSFWFGLAAIGGGFFYAVVIILERGYDPSSMSNILGGIPLPDVRIPPLFPGNEVGALRFLSYIVGAIVLVFGLFQFFALRERFQEANRRHVNIWRAILATLGNRPYRLVVMMSVVDSLTILTRQMSSFVVLYYICGGDRLATFGFLTGYFLILSFVMPLVMMFVAAPLTRAFGKRAWLLVGYGAAFLGAVAAPFFAIPGHYELWAVYGIIFALPSCLSGPMMGSLMPDICDVDELTSGERREGLYLTVEGVIIHLELALCMFLSGYVVMATGGDFSPGVTTQSAEVLTKMRWLAFAPAIVTSAVVLVLAWFYPLSGEVMANVRAQLDARHAAAAAAEPGLQPQA